MYLKSNSEVGTDIGTAKNMINMSMSQQHSFQLTIRLFDMVNNNLNFFCRMARGVNDHGFPFANDDVAVGREWIETKGVNSHGLVCLGKDTVLDLYSNKDRALATLQT